jgi:DNA ligase-1
MQQPWQVIQALESDNSRLAKEAIVREQAAAGNAVFFEGCRLALDSMITFGIKQVPEKTDRDIQTNPIGLSWDAFTLAITGFVNRDVTGNTARDMIHHLMLAATQEEWNHWYRRILIKDLRCGVSEKTINNVVKKDYDRYSVPVFTVQLAHDFGGDESAISGTKLLEVKLDGVRVVTIVYPSGRVDQFSRNGKELANFPTIREQLSVVASSFTEPMVLDGEVMSTSFQDLMKQVHRKSDVQTTDALLYLFDAVPLSAFETGRCEIVQKQRSQWLKSWYEGHMNQLPNLRMLDQAEVDLDTEEGQRLFKMYNKSAIENGYEGLMLKDPAAPYECKRAKSWQKMKPVIEVSLEIVDVEEGTGRNAGRLGALVCTGVDDGRLIRVNVGSGFSDADRDQFWAARDSIVGQIVEIRADVVTQNQDGSYSLRFPRFLRFRGFTAGEKI